MKFNRLAMFRPWQWHNAGAGSFFYAHHCNLDTAVLRATLVRAVIGDRVGLARTADLKLLWDRPRD